MTAARTRAGWWTRASVPALAAALLTVTATSCDPPAARYPGDVNGRVCMGFSAPDFGARLAEIGGPVCVHRSFFEWGALTAIRNQIAEDHAAGRLPWVSIKPPPGLSAANAWAAIARGDHDPALGDLAEMLVAVTVTRPALFTFHHEPDNDAPDDEGPTWAAAYSHIHDVLDGAGALRNVADPPVMMEWLFNPRNPRDPARWITAGVRQRMPFLGLDVYENDSGTGLAERIPPILQWMRDQGVTKVVGVAEMGCTDKAYPALTAVECLRANYSWARDNPDKIGVISYFNSVANSPQATYWPLDEGAPASHAKMDEYRRWLDDPVMLRTHPD